MRAKTNLPPFPGWGEVPPDEPDDFPLNGELPRDHAQVRETILDFVQRQPVLAGWLSRREAAYRKCAFMWPQGAVEYAAARDAAVWQLRRSPARIFEVLESCRVDARQAVSRVRIPPVRARACHKAGAQDSSCRFEPSTPERS